MTNQLILRVIPLLGDFAGLVVKDVLSSQLRKGSVKGRAAPVSPATNPKAGESPPQWTVNATGCPYCQCASALAAAYRYLSRANERPHLASIYRELALQHVYEGSTALDRLHLAVDSQTDVLRNRVVALGLALSSSAPEPNYEACAEQAWQASAIALEQAEVFERNLSAMDIAVARLDQELDSMGQSMEER